MKYIIKVCLFLMVFQMQAQKAEIVVQAAHNGYVTKTFIDTKRDLLISFGSYTDKTLKFWNKNNGILLKTIDFQEFAKSVDFSEELGLTFLGYENRIDVYSNDTFRLMKSMPVNHFHKLAFRASTKELLFFAGEESKIDYNDGTTIEGKITLHTLDVNTGKISKKSNVDYPSFGAPFYLRINKSGHHLSMYTSNTENYIYDIEQDKYFLMEQAPIEIFENDDLLYVFATDNTHVKAIRYNSYKKEIVWEKELVIEKIEKEGEIESSQIALSKDEKTFWLAPATSTLIEIDAATGDVLGVIYTRSKKRNIIADNDYVYALELASDALFTHGFYSKYKKYDKNPVTRFGFPIFSSSSFKTFKNSTGSGLVFSDLDGNILSFFSNSANSFITKYQTNFTETYSLSGDIYINKDANEFFYVTNNYKEGIKTFKIGDKNSFKTKYTRKTDGSNKPVLNLETNKSVQVFNTYLEINNLSANQLIYKQQLEDVTNIVSNDVRFSPSGNSAAILINDEIQFELTYKMKLYFLDMNTKKIRWSKQKTYTHLFFIENGTKLLVFNKDSQKAEVLDVTNGKKIREFSLSGEGFSDFAQLSPLKNKIITQVRERGLKVYDVKTGQVHSETAHFKQNYYTNIQFISNQIYVNQDDNMFVFYDISNHKEIMRLYIFLDGEWIAHTPEGLFDGSQNAWKRLVFVKGKETIPLDQIFNKFYTPRLFYKIISEEKVEKPEVDIDQLKKAPTVTISYSEGSRNLTVEDDVNTIETKNPSAKITVTANAMGDRISEIQLFHNGKRVSLNTRNLIVEDDTSSSNSKVFNITLLEGKNTLKALALNSQKTESAPEILYVDYTKPKEIKNDAHGIQVHLLVIGINEYKNPKYNLNYAVADATAFTQAVRKGISSMTSKVNTYTINNKDANRIKILETLEQINKAAKPQDIFLFYYAGHGVITQDASKEFFIVPYDVTQLYGAVESLRQKGISASELKSIASAIPAQKQLYILDACQSAGALDAVASRGVAEEKAIAQLARSTGTHWLTASGSEQYATEFDELGHGVFTYALLEALSGKADSGDKRITVNEIKAYIESRVPEISEKYKGSPQYPSSFGFGQDFPVSIKN